MQTWNSFVELSSKEYLMPFDHSCLLRRVSILTSGVPICFSANFLISLIARGARFLNPTPWRRLWRFTVYSRVTTSLIALFPFFSDDLAIFHLQFWNYFVWTNYMWLYVHNHDLSDRSREKTQFTTEQKYPETGQNEKRHVSRELLMLIHNSL